MLCDKLILSTYYFTRMQDLARTTTIKLNQGLTYSSKLFSLQNIQILTWIVISVGIFLRLFHFLYNRSLWTDEVFLSNSLIRMNFLRLAIGPLEYEQKAPIGFLWMVKLCVLVFGKKEMALRLFSLICGISSLFVFKQVANTFLKPTGVLIAMSILAVGPPLIYYSVEVKQYATDLLATSILLYFYIHYHQRKDIVSLAVWGLLGALVIWFSYPSIFILAGMAFALCLNSMSKRDWQTFFLYMIPFTLWMLSFVTNYFLFTHKHADSKWLIEWFDNHKSFMPLPPASLKDLAWFFTMPLTMLHFALGLSWLDLDHSYNPFIRGIARMPLLPLVCCIIGAVVFFKRERKHFLVMILPFLLAILASGLRMYPLFERLFIFLAPMLILFISRGCQQIMVLLPYSKWKYIIPILLLVGAIGNSLSILSKPSTIGKHSKMMNGGRAALLYINHEIQEGDEVYIYWNFEHLYRYYKEAYELKYEAIVGLDMKSEVKNLEEYANKLDADFTKLASHKRVWLVYNKFRKFNIGSYPNQSVCFILLYIS